MEKKFSVAIDGPSGAGKSTLAKAAAERFGFLYLDTGAIYRTVGLQTKRAGVSPEDAGGVAALLPGLKISFEYDADGAQRMFINGEDVTKEIRMPDISMYASAVSAIPAVRAFLLDMQRQTAVTHDVIMDGRDIGTVVLPDADVKIFLTASAEKRAERRYEELRLKGVNSSLAEVLDDINRRDKNDSSRSAAPLKAADDAVLLDTTELSLQESIERLAEIISAAIPGRNGG